MKRIVSTALLCIIALMTTVAQADVVFFLRPDTGTSTYVAGQVITFDVVTTSDVAPLTTLGYDMFVQMSDQTGAGGMLTGGTTNGLGGWDSLAFPGFSGLFSTNLTGIYTTTATEVIVGTVTLNTTGAVDGNYSISFDDGQTFVLGSAGDPNFTTQAFNYVITAVPEPAVGSLLGLCAVVGLVVRRRRVA